MAEKTLTRDGLPLVTRADASFRRNSFDADAYTIVVSLGTGAPVQRWDYAERRGYIEVLSMDPGAIRLGRMNSGALFIQDHASYSVESTIGAFVPDSVRVENGELIGVVKLSRSERAADTVRDIIDGVLTSTSVGYLVHSWEITEGADGTETRTATDWEPYEGSIVVVPADVTGGVRSAAVADHNSPMEGGKMGEVKENAVNEQAARDAEIKAAAEKAVKDYADRCADIRAAGRKMGLEQDQIEGMVENRALTADSAIRAMLDLRAAKDAEKPTNCRVDVTADEREKRSGLIENALCVRSNIKGVEVNRDAQREFGALTLVEIIRSYLGGDARFCSETELYQRMTSSDFPLILANLGQKALLARTPQIEEYMWFTKLFSRMDYNDYKAHNTPWLGTATTLAQVNEGDTYTSGSMNERNEASQAFDYGRDFDFTRQMMINDDSSAFTMGAELFAEAAWRTASNLCGALLSGNQTMGDGKQLFHNDHANIGASGGVPTAARINDLDQLLLNQTRPVPGGGTERIGTAGRFLLIPASLKPTIRQLFMPIARPDYTTEMVAAGIPEENQIIVPPFSGTAYYMATGRTNAARYGFLRGENGLVMSTYPVEAADKLVYHARLTFGAHINLWEDFAMNAGA